MSVSISGGVSAAGVPQLRSRSVSLRIGPFGLTYATDQVLWRTGGAQSLAETRSESGPVRASEAAGDATAAAAPEVTGQARQQVAQPSRSFAQELIQARVQTQLQSQARQTQPVGRAETEDAENEADGAGGQSALGQGADGQTGQTGQTGGAGRGGSALKRAIGAYLACAACLSRPSPMLQATA